MIIGVSGKIGSGKDTVGSIIQYLYYVHSDIDVDKKLSYEAFNKTDRANNLLVSNVVPIIKKYADKLKDIVCVLLSCTREQLEDRDFKETELGEEWWYFIETELAKDSKDNSIYLIYDYNTNREKENSKYYKLVKPTPRLLLQLMGTECGRQILHPNIWVNSTMIDYKSKIRKDDGFVYTEMTNGTTVKWKDTPEFEPLHYPNWIITDVRFPNEAKAIKQREGINIRLQRGGDYDIDNKQHESETALDNYEFDYIIDNNYTIEALIEQVREILIKENII